jgi:hypothetical protein
MFCGTPFDCYLVLFVPQQTPVDWVRTAAIRASLFRNGHDSLVARGTDQEPMHPLAEAAGIVLHP